MSEKEEEPPKVRLYTIPEFADLARVSYWTVYKMILDGAIYTNEIVRMRSCIRITHDAYERLVNKPKTFRTSKTRRMTPEEEAAKRRHEQACENIKRELGRK